MYDAILIADYKYFNSSIWTMTVRVKTWRATFSKSLSTICLMLAMFFNPFGFDVLFKMTMNWTGSYWITDVIFYSIAALFFGLYFFFNKKSKK